jgi:VIT1/CCC1 family predicted Fe2+/Mn2+ transporter
MLPEAQLTTARLNWLRAAVLGANDGIVSTAAIILGVAGATDDRSTILTAGFAGLVAGALSMALGEYVSVSSQRDSEMAFIAKEKQELAADPEGELKELAAIYQAKGLSKTTANKVAQELSAKDPVKAHLEAELQIDEEDLSSPTHAAIASAISFTVGALIPLAAVLIASADMRIGVTFVAVVAALFITGYLSATVGGASRRKAILRVVVGGALAMAVTYAVGHLFGTVV